MHFVNPVYSCTAGAALSAFGKVTALRWACSCSLASWSMSSQAQLCAYCLQLRWHAHDVQFAAK